MALEQLREIEAAPNSPLEIISISNLKGIVAICVSIDCSTIPQTFGGMPLRQREKLEIRVPRDFPFANPSLYCTHRRWENYPHVYWATYLCLYQAPDTEWNPSDGMFGFVTRIDVFLRAAASGQLDPVGAPLHPPTTPDSGKKDLPTIVPQVDTPRTVAGQPWFGFAAINKVSEHRIDIAGWQNLFADTWPTTPVAPALLLEQPMSHLFPDTVGKLIVELATRGVSRNLLLAIIRCGLLLTSNDDPLILIIGAPMRGTKGDKDLKQHLTAWYLPPEAARVLRLSIPRPTDNDELRQLREDLEQELLEMIGTKKIHWCPVLEARPEIITRRDITTAMNWFFGKKVALWGCGAIGAALAEALVRAGVDHLILYDNAIVKPGVLVRQPYNDREIGSYKAEVLKERLLSIRPTLEVESRIADIKRLVLGRSDWHDDVDIILDATASRSVLTKLELKRKTHFHAVPIASFVIGPKAQRAMLIVTAANHSGGPFDAGRAAKVELLRSSRSSPYLSDFFPVTSPSVFQPEPGCSEPTFVGSFADVAVLSYSMLNAVPEILMSIRDDQAEVVFCSQPTASPRQRLIRLRFGGRIVSVDGETGFETRISEDTWIKLQTHIARSAWRRGKRVETGGVILGEKDEVLRVIWVDEVTGPPKDSTMSETEFICGTRGTAALHRKCDLQSRGSVRYIGMWHTHPDSAPLPSPTDMMAMLSLSAQTGSSDAHTLMLIVGTPYHGLCLATYVFSRSELSNGNRSRTCILSFPPSILQHRKNSSFITIMIAAGRCLNKLFR